MSDADLDRDLESIRQARQLARAAAGAQQEVEGFTQAQVDAIVEQMAAAGLAESERLAHLACEETGFGNVPDKIRKNNFVLEDVVAALRGMRTVGVLREDREHKVFEIAEPVGVVAAVIPSTNPTSTALFKCLISVKARCGIVLSPHPSARECVRESAAIMHAAAVEAGAPEGLIGCMTEVTMDGTRELLNGKDTHLILATGGLGLVKAAYSAGKPAYGVGPGNVPAYIERSADVAKAVRDVVSGTTFDNGTLCSSEQAIICDREIKNEVLAQVHANGGYVLSPEETERLAAVLITDKFLVNTDLVGRPATTIASAAGIEVSESTRLLVCPVDGVGRDYPLSHEKLSPVLAFYVVEDWQEGCARCTELLRFGGMGHTLVIHSRDDDIIMQFGLRKPAHRVLVNTVAALGAIGLTTYLFPSMTLGCGSWGNNITSDNIGPQHLINVKRLAYETREYVPGLSAAAMSSAATSYTRVAVSPGIVRGSSPAPPGDLESEVAAFLTRRGLLRQGADSPPVAGRHTVISVKAGEHGGETPAGPAPTPPRGRAPTGSAAHTERPAAPSAAAETRGPATASRPPVDFVAEDDVRVAVERGEKIRIGPDTIITPLAREQGEEHEVFRRN